MQRTRQNLPPSHVTSSSPPPPPSPPPPLKAALLSTAPCFSLPACKQFIRVEFSRFSFKIDETYPVLTTGTFGVILRSCFLTHKDGETVIRSPGRGQGKCQRGAGGGGREGACGMMEIGYVWGRGWMDIRKAVA